MDDMNDFILDGPRNTSWISVALGDQQFENQRGFFAWWYRRTSPPPPLPDATFAERDMVRRGRIASALMLFLAGVLVFVYIIALIGPNKQIATTVYTLYPIIALCVFLNRKGYVNLVGVFLTVGLVGGMCLTLFTTAAHGGLTPNDKDILYLFFFAELFVGAILPINFIFLVATINVCISIYMLSFAHHTPAFDAMLTTGYFSILFRIVEIHVLVSCVMWVVVNVGIIAIRRANRGEELARLTGDIALRNKERADEKKVLEAGITAISEVHARIANGDLSARAPLTAENNPLWHIAGQLNYLLARYENALKELDYYHGVIEKQQLERFPPQSNKHYPKTILK